MTRKLRLTCEAVAGRFRKRSVPQRTGPVAGLVGGCRSLLFFARLELSRGCTTCVGAEIDLIGIERIAPHTTDCCYFKRAAVP
jgi:hypothetical protein